MEYCKLHLKDRWPALGADGKDPTLELYLPTNLAEMGRQDLLRPAVLILPGGGYCFCSTREAEPLSLQFLPQGYNAFVLTYSVDNRHFPTQLIEVAAALELIHENAAHWHVDTAHIALMGSSAGGHLAAHYANAYDCPEVRAVFPESKAINASILSYPVITGDMALTHQGSIINVSGSEQPTREQQDFFSCEKLVTRRTPPAFLWHTAPDDCVPVQNSLLYAAALAANQVPFELHIYPKGGHGLSTVDGSTCDALDPGVDRAHGWISAATAWLSDLFGWGRGRK